MSNQDLDVEDLAEMAAEFLKTRYGKWVIPKLAEIYNDEHHKAEEATTGEEKAFHVERAAGVRLGMDLLMHDAALLKSGYFNKPKEKPPEQ